MTGSTTFFSDWQLYNFYCSPSDYTTDNPRTAVISITMDQRRWTFNTQAVTMLVSEALLGSPYRTDVEEKPTGRQTDRQTQPEQ